MSEKPRQVRIEEKRFRKIYILQHAPFDFRVLGLYGEEVIFLTTGLEELEDIPAKIVDGLRDFDPDQDAIVPIGKVSANFLAGATLTRKFDPGTTVSYGIYVPAEQVDRNKRSNGDYIWLSQSL